LIFRELSKEKDEKGNYFIVFTSKMETYPLKEILDENLY